MSMIVISDKWRVQRVPAANSCSQSSRIKRLGIFGVLMSVVPAGQFASAHATENTCFL